MPWATPASPAIFFMVRPAAPSRARHRMVARAISSRRRGRTTGRGLMAPWLIGRPTNYGPAREAGQEATVRSAGAAALLGGALGGEAFQGDLGVVSEGHGVRDGAVSGHLRDQAVHALAHATVRGMPLRRAAQ